MTLENEICEELKRLNKEYLYAMKEYKEYLYLYAMKECNKECNNYFYSKVRDELYKEYKKKELILISCRDFAETILNKKIVICLNGNIIIYDKE